MFRTEAIVLKKTPIRDGEYLYHLFSRDFGKIRAWGNKRKKLPAVDHGSVVQCLLSTKQGKNTIESSEVVRTIQTDNTDYRCLLNILNCLRTVDSISPEWVTNAWLFDDYLLSLPFFEQHETNARSIELFLMKLLKTSGVAWRRTETESIIFKKVYANIEQYSLKGFYALKEIEEGVLEEIRCANQNCLVSYVS